MPDLSLVPIEDMLEEISSRCTAVVLAYELHEYERWGATFHYRGGVTPCVGLLTRMLWQFARDDTDKRETIDE